VAQCKASWNRSWGVRNGILDLSRSPDATVTGVAATMANDSFERGSAVTEQIIMRILSIEEAADVLKTSHPKSFFEDMEWRYPDPVPSYFIPKDSGPKVGLARIIANTYLDRGPALLWITETGIYSSAEHMDLFVRYRRSYGESRSIADAPIHIFESDEDRDGFISLLCLGLFFYWDMETISLDRSLAMTISHDEWLEYRFAPGNEHVVFYFQKYFGWLASGKSGTGT